MFIYIMYVCVYIYVFVLLMAQKREPEGIHNNGACFGSKDPIF